MSNLKKKTSKPAVKVATKQVAAKKVAVDTLATKRVVIDLAESGLTLKSLYSRRDKSIIDLLLLLAIEKLQGDSAGKVDFNHLIKLVELRRDSTKGSNGGSAEKVAASSVPKRFELKWREPLEETD